MEITFHPYTDKFLTFTVSIRSYKFVIFLLFITSLVSNKPLRSHSYFVKRYSLKSSLLTLCLTVMSEKTPHTPWIIYIRHHISLKILFCISFLLIIKLWRSLIVCLYFPIYFVVVFTSTKTTEIVIWIVSLLYLYIRICIQISLMDFYSYLSIFQCFRLIVFKPLVIA